MSFVLEDRDKQFLTDPPRERYYRFAESVLSDIGRRRKENQDAYGIAHTSLVSLYLVADGMGGARGGATASALAVNLALKEAVNADGTLSLSSLKSALEAANKIIFENSQRNEELSGMGTTIVALAFVADAAILAHVGDSRIYRVRDGQVVQLTRDHTLVQELVESGAIPANEAANHPIAHMLTRSLGPAESVEVEIHKLREPVEVGDRFLLCTDGLYNLVSNEEINSCLVEYEVQEAVQKLVNLALERGGTDNVTVQAVEVRDIADPRVAAEIPASGTLNFEVSKGEDVIHLLHPEILSDAIVAEAKEKRVDTEPSLEATSTQGMEGNSNNVEFPVEKDSLEGVTSDEGRLVEEVDEIDFSFAEQLSGPVIEDDWVDDLNKTKPWLPSKSFRIGASGTVGALLVLVIAIYIGKNQIPLKSIFSTSFEVEVKNKVVLNEGLESPSVDQRSDEDIVSDANKSSDDGALNQENIRITESGAYSTDSIEDKTEQHDQALELPALSPLEISATSHLSLEQTAQEINSAAISPLGTDVIKAEEKVAVKNISSLPSLEQTESEPLVNKRVEIASSNNQSEQELLLTVPAQTEGPMGEGEKLAVSKGRSVEHNLKDRGEPLDLESAEALVKATNERDLMQIVQQANSLEVPPPPRVRLPSGHDPADLPSRPIVWENEELKLSKLIAQDSRLYQRSGPSFGGAYPGNSGVPLLGAEEQAKITEEKIGLRNRIADLDLEIEILGYIDQKALASKREAVQSQLQRLNVVIKQTEVEFAAAVDKLSLWQGFKEDSLGRRKVKLAEQIAEVNDSIRIKYAEYAEASVKYLEAVDAWQRDPKDLDGASRMGALGRVLGKARSRLEESVARVIETTLEQSLDEAVELAYTLENLEQRRSMLNKHLGRLNGLIRLENPMKKKFMRTYLQRREDLLNKLISLQSSLSDPEETDYRRVQLRQNLSPG